MKKILLQIILILIPVCLYAQVSSGERHWRTATYKGMIYDGATPWGEGTLTYEWDEKRMEVIKGTFKNDTVLNAHVDLIPEGCSYSGSLKYDIDSSAGILTLRFINGTITINSKNYVIENQEYKSYYYDREYSLGAKSVSDKTYWLSVGNADAEEFTVDFNDLYADTDFPLIKESAKTLKLEVYKPIRLQLKLGKKKIEVIKESKDSYSRIKSKDGNFIIVNQQAFGTKKMIYKFNKSSQMTFHGVYESSNHFKIRSLSNIDFTLKDATKMMAETTDMSDLSFKGAIKYNNGDVLSGNYKLNLSNYNSFFDYATQATVNDVDIKDGKISTPEGKVITYKSPEEIEREKQELQAKQEEERKAKVLAERLAKQKEDSIWNTIPIQKYSGLYQPDTKRTSGLVETTEDRTKTLIGNITYSYRVRDGKRVFEGPVKYHNDFITITGNYEHGIKTGKWTIKYNADKDTRRSRGNSLYLIDLIDLYDIEIEYKDGKKNGRYTLVEKHQNGSIISQMSLIMKNDEVVEVVNATFPSIYYSSSGRDGHSSIYIYNPKISGSVNGRSYMLNIIPTGTQKEIYGIFYESEYALVYKNKSTGETQSMPSNDESGAYGAITKEIRYILLNIEIILP